MSEYAILGKVVLKDKIIDDGAVVISGNKIKYAGECAGADLPEHITDTYGKIIGPGFIDIHCHSGDGVKGFDNPREMADYHLKQGATGILCSTTRELPVDEMIESIYKVKTAMEENKNILGVHLEGPYLNPDYGAKCSDEKWLDPVPERVDYIPMFESGIIRQMTFAPELKNTDMLLEDAKKAGIVLAIGHSEASPERIYEVCKKGVKIVTHLTNATGSSVEFSGNSGVKGVSFDAATMLCDNLYYEIICDKNGIHVPHDLIRLIIKTVGLDKIVAVSDANCVRYHKWTDDDSDVNYNVRNQLSGSKLTMLRAARNFSSLGLNMCDIFKITAYNPACAIGMDSTIGSLTAGMFANLVIADKDLLEVQTILMGKFCPIKS